MDDTIISALLIAANCLEDSAHHDLELSQKSRNAALRQAAVYRARRRELTADAKAAA